MNQTNPTQMETNDGNIEKNLYKNTLLHLAEMLKILRQGDNKITRQKLKDHCLVLSELGKKAQFTKWVRLLETAGVAIADTNNLYVPTSKIIIKEIKQASEYVIKNKRDQIEISNELKQLVPESFLKLISAEDVREEIDESQIQEETITVNSDLWRNTETVVIEHDQLSPQQITAKENLSVISPSNLSEETYVIENYVSDGNEGELIDEYFEDEPLNNEIETRSSIFLKEEENLNLTEGSLSWGDINLFGENQTGQKENDSEEEVFAILEDLEEDEPENNGDDDGQIEIEVNETEARGDSEISSVELEEIFKETLRLDDEDEIPTSIPRFSIESKQEDLIETNFGSKQENSLKSNVLFSESLAELEPFIDSEIKTRRFVNWQKLSNLIEENVSNLESGEFFRPTLIMEMDNDQISPKKSQPESAKKLDEKELSDLEQLDQLLAQAQSSKKKQKWKGKPKKTEQKSPHKVFEQTMRVPVKQLDSLNNLVGEMVVRRNKLEEDQERLRRFLDSLLGNVQNLSDVGVRMQDLYERSLLEGALLASRERNQARIKQQLAASKPTNTNNNEQIFPNQNLGLDDLELDRFSGFHVLSQDIIELIVRIRESTSDIQFLVDETEQLGRNLRQVTTQIQEEINKSRMVPFAQTADRLPRAVRDISITYNKQIKLKVEGREVLIDKMILEHLWDPIQQLVKNAITHGIEIPGTREKKGKPRSGTITIRTFLQGPQTVISVSDDGAGIDPEQVKQKAIEKKLMTKAQASNLNTQDIYEFLFFPGFSTRDKADSHAGRGVGLDIVRSKLNEVRGAVAISSNLGKGTTFTIRLPLTLSIGKALCCINGYGSIAFPMDGIEDTKDYTEKDVQINEKGEKCIPWRGSLLPFKPLGDLLTYNRQTSRSIIYSSNLEEEVISIVILRGGNNLLAVQVDQIIGQEEIVIKQISGPLPKPKGIAGATVRSNGIVMPIGDVIELIEIAHGNLAKDTMMDIFSSKISKEQTMVEMPIKIEPLVLIIDDSITVREMLSTSFNKAGYRVEQARDGQEAWQKLKSGLPCDIVFCDIEMPRMNGLELLKNIQGDPSLSEIPVAILSSRGAEKHQQMAGELGASAYLVKPYVEKDLLDSAQKMMEGEVLLATSNKKSKSKQFAQNIPKNIRI